MIILSFLKSWWREIGCALGLLFAVLLFRAQGALSQCEGNAKVPTTVSATQAQAVTSTAKALVRIVYRQVAGQPCPQIEAEAIVEAQNTQNQAQNTSVTASTGGQNGARTAFNGIFLGGGYLGAPYAQIGLQIGSVQVYGMSKGTEHGGGIAFKVFGF